MRKQNFKNVVLRKGSRGMVMIHFTNRADTARVFAYGKPEFTVRLGELKGYIKECQERGYTFHAVSDGLRYFETDAIYWTLLDNGNYRMWCWYDEIFNEDIIDRHMLEVEGLNFSDTVSYFWRDFNKAHCRSRTMKFRNGVCGDARYQRA